MPFCPNCGAEINAGISFCPYCGGRVGSAPEKQLIQNDSSSIESQVATRLPDSPVLVVQESAPVTADHSMPFISSQATKFCQHCGQRIAQAAVICPNCGCQVEEIQRNIVTQPNIVINNSNQNMNTNTVTNTVYVHGGKPKNKWVAILLCIFLGMFGGHKFYEGKIGMGILYIFTGGLIGIGCLVDLISLLFKPNPYYV